MKCTHRCLLLVSLVAILMAGCSHPLRQMTNVLQTSSDKSEGAVEMPVPDVFLDVLPKDEVITFSSATTGATVYTGTSSNLSATQPDTWTASNTITLSSAGFYKFFAQAQKSGMPGSDVFAEVILISTVFAPPAGLPGSDAVSKDSGAIVSWTTGYENYNVGSDCSESWQTPSLALGEAEESSFDIVCLGNGGEITLTFDSPVTDGSGVDFAVFENGFNNTFLELAYVEVSSDGINFVRFDCISLTGSAVGAFGSLNPQAIYGLASRYRQGYGTPFDLSWLKYKDAVLDGTVDLSEITHVRIVDIWGNPASGITDYDSFGNIIYDPYKCVGSGGFDLDAVGVINEL